MFSLRFALPVVLSFAALAHSAPSSNERSADAHRANGLVKRIDLIRNLFPLGEGDNSWSTADGATNYNQISDSTLGAFDVMSGVTHGSSSATFNFNYIN